ncbi:DUF397 domain-containing protein [Kitasatospora sp. NPDC094028]
MLSSLDVTHTLVIPGGSFNTSSTSFRSERHCPMSHLAWQKSSFSSADGGTNCIELATDTKMRLHLRESDDPAVIVTTTTATLRAFLLGAKAGDFDYLA